MNKEEEESARLVHLHSPMDPGQSPNASPIPHSLKEEIKVKWCDSATYKEWYTSEEVKDLIVPDEHCISIGFLAYEDDDCIVLAGNKDNYSFSALTKIPKCCIISKEEGKHDKK